MVQILFEFWFSFEVISALFRSLALSTCAINNMDAFRKFAENVENSWKIAQTTWKVERVSEWESESKQSNQHASHLLFIYLSVSSISANNFNSKFWNIRNLKPNTVFGFIGNYFHRVSKMSVWKAIPIPRERGDGKWSEDPTIAITYEYALNEDHIQV